MSKRYFIDTSALIKLYHDEEGTSYLVNMINSDNPNIIISELTIIEMISAFAKKVRMNKLDRKIFEQVVLSFESDVLLYELVLIDEIVKNRAIKLLKEIGTIRGLKALDALQLSCVLCVSENAPIDNFIVSDNILSEVGKSQGINVQVV